MPKERLQKFLANLGIASRRQAELLIQSGRIKINARIAKLGDTVSEKDRIYFDNRLIKRQQKQSIKILMYHKPAGEICTRSDPQKRKTVFDSLPNLKKGRWIVIGRLDLNSSGLLLFTNNGEFANRMMHPSSQIEREYKVRVLGKLSQVQIKQLKKGVKLEESFMRFKRIIALRGTGQNQWYQVILTEGKNREVRRLFESQNLSVNRLIRIRFGEYILPKKLLPGKFRLV